MLSFAPLFPPRRAPRILFLGAHSDDLEIGCGGTVLELAARYPRARVRWVVATGSGEREREARASAKALLRGFHRAEVTVAGFRDGFLPQSYGDVKEFFESLKRDSAPDLILTHTLHDRHQDHRLISELTWNTWRDVAVLEYEIPKYEGDLGAPNLYVPLGRRSARRKVEHLMRHFGSQRSRRWFTADTFEGHMRLRGIECNARSGRAEAFHGRKICV
ncbi:MAG: GlcNAc-PI de-N-acetylase [Gammaproteobacteria bacterium SG8_30]|jgi:LmbE family N-acetylglucosaminyl deacetylase|nr:MAG: GlcNAc-PI de-N-acetylase [Gammaproteobacteria bacterium SG8_30]